MKQLYTQEYLNLKTKFDNNYEDIKKLNELLRDLKGTSFVEVNNVIIKLLDEQKDLVTAMRQVEMFI